jgi:disulfide bond formation protein DsbB
MSNQNGDYDATEPIIIEDPTFVQALDDATTVMPAVPAAAAAAASTAPAYGAPAPAPQAPAAAAAADAAPAQTQPPQDAPWRWLGKLLYWAVLGWMLAYTGVMLGAFTVQFLEGEFPCPLCMLQRYAMILSSLAAMWIVMQARRGTLTMGRYAQGLGLGLLAALAGATVSTRQVLLHILPGDPGYGSAVMGLHLYTWALITFVVVALFTAVALILMPKAVATAPGTSWFGRVGGGISTLVMWLFMIVVAANVIAIIFLQGAAWVLPDDPTSYNLLDQIGLGS